MNKSPDRDVAIVVGLCAHGLSVARALGRRGIVTYALESNDRLPGFVTRSATVLAANEINGPGVVQALLSVRDEIASELPPVLLLTNDNMVRQVGTHWDSLKGLYRLSWSHARDPILSLLLKSNLEKRCSDVGLNYPRSWVITDASSEALAEGILTFPVIVKPVKPLGGFKTRLAGTRQQLMQLVDEFHADLPLLVQQWIEGDDSRLQFSALYLDEGKVLGRFDGRKLRSSPPTLGQTVVAESFPDDEVFQATHDFFSGLALSGPVSLEFKRDRSGDLWVIEPTVGRTDYWLPVCIANGIDLPSLEFGHVTGRAPAPATQRSTHIWYDTERDVPCALRLLLRDPQKVIRHFPVFPFLDTGDLRPFWRSLVVLGRETIARVVRAARRFIHRRPVARFGT